MLTLLSVQSSVLHLHLGESDHHSHDGVEHSHAHEIYSFSGKEHQKPAAELEFSQLLLLKSISIDLLLFGVSIILIMLIASKPFRLYCYVQPYLKSHLYTTLPPPRAPPLQA
ncbi:hypothetical protein ACMXYO_00280 [Neptuniibacter sp. QD37_6]|uniref:hypothetical protein n=1 Tax=Neptuniibacter sp. QD37_6 TaxID=3398210 RepID=UPI0039F4747A